jgi:nucleoside-diphosphate-sugar epimerase
MTNHMNLILGTGPLGRATAKALLYKGEEVTLLNRSGRLDHAPHGAVIVAGDLAKPEAILDSVREYKAVYFCAQPPYHRWTEEFPALQAAAIKVAQYAEAKLIVAENLYGYGPVDRPMTEDMSLRPNSRKGKVRAEMHETLMAAHHSGLVRVAVARGSDFFGPHVEGSAVGSRAFKALVAGKSVECFGNVDMQHSYTYVEDFGTALAILGTDDRSLGNVWHVPNAKTVTTREFWRKASDIAGLTSKLRKVGRLEMKILGLFIPPVKEMQEMMYEFEQPFVLDDTKFTSTFGNIATPLEDALKQTIGWTQKS